MSKLSKQQIAALIRLGLILAFLGYWEWGARTERLNPFFYSSPSAIGQRLFKWFSEGTIWEHLLITVSEMLVGFFIGALLGLIGGFLLARSEWLDAILSPIAAVLNSVPRIILAPLFILWFGLGFASKVVLIVSLVALLVFFTTYQSIKNVDPNIIANARILGASRFDLAMHVLIPAALTWILNSLRVSAGFALIGAVVGEFLGATRGIGYLVSFATSMFDADGLFAGLTVLLIFAGTFDYMLGRIEKRFSVWQPRRENI